MLLVPLVAVRTLECLQTRGKEWSWWTWARLAFGLELLGNACPGSGVGARCCPPRVVAGLRILRNLQHFLHIFPCPFGVFGATFTSNGLKLPPDDNSSEADVTERAVVLFGHWLSAVAAKSDRSSLRVLLADSSSQSWELLRNARQGSWLTEEQVSLARDQLRTALLERLQVRSVRIVDSALSALRASKVLGAPTGNSSIESDDDDDENGPCLDGLVVDIGFAITRVVPVINGEVLRDRICSVPIGGSTLTNYFISLLGEGRYTPLAGLGLLAIKDLKERYCRVATDFAAAQTAAEETGAQEVRTLGDLRLVLTKEPFTVPEALFRFDLLNESLLWADAPALIRLFRHRAAHGKGLQHLVLEAANAATNGDQAKFRQLLGNIVVCGGSGGFQGLEARLALEVKELLSKQIQADALNVASSQSAVRVCTMWPEERPLLQAGDRVWVGAADLALSESF